MSQGPVKALIYHYMRVKLLALLKFLEMFVWVSTKSATFKCLPKNNHFPFPMY